jgi:uncharacterized protein
MHRFYTKVFEEHFKENRQMIFIMGPRQAGKTTTSLAVKEQWGSGHYFNWDRLADRIKILAGSDTIANELSLDKLSEKPPIVIFDEIHKYPEWKNFLKGFYDSYSHQTKILVTGSSRLNVFKKGGDSLMGRYFYYHFHPLTVAEIIDPETLHSSELRPIPQPIEENLFQMLLKYGGFPDPFLKNNTRFSNRWKTLRFEQLFEEDIRDLAKIQEIGQMEVLAELLRHQVGQLTSYESLAKKVRVSSPTIRHWLEVLKSFYYCFEVRPYSKNITRSLLKEPKYYLWDWSFCEENGSRFENLIASHLYKAVHFWTDYGLGDYKLKFLRDKEKREVDFIVVKNGQPWILVEVKSSDNKQISPSLRYFQEMTGAPYAFQVILDMPYVNKSCFEVTQKPLIVPARTFLSQLV